MRFISLVKKNQLYVLNVRVLIGIKIIKNKGDKLKYIKTEIPDFVEKSYVDIYKAFRIGVIPLGHQGCKVRAYFLTSHSANSENKIYPIYVDIKEFKTEKEAHIWITKLLGSFLEGVK